MKYLMSRFGGNTIIFGKGKASEALLPEDQSLDNMIDNYANEIIPNFFFISSYDAQPIWLESFHWSNFSSPPIKIGTLKHQFLEIIAQNEITATTDIYIKNHYWPNVYAIFIKTHKQSLINEILDYTETYDYVLQVFIRSKDDIKTLNAISSRNLERILTVLFYKMELIYENTIFSFTPSKTCIGKKLSTQFVTACTTLLYNINTDEQLKEILKNKGYDYTS